MRYAQFDLLTSLMRMTSAPVLAAARLVLVAGQRQADAAREAGCRQDNLARAVRQIREADAAIRSAYQINACHDA